MAEQRLNQAPLFNSEHLLSKSIPELVGSGINLCVQLSHSINWDSNSQFLDRWIKCKWIKLALNIGN